MQQELLDAVSDLDDVANLLKNSFVAKDEIIEMLIIGAIAQEHLLLAGPPGTGKSELVKRFAHLCTPRQYDEQQPLPYFEYLLTRFTEPNELFGPVDIKTFQAGGGYQRIVKGLLPTTEIAFLDEIFKANSAILNALLTILNERIFYNGGRPEHIPLLFLVGATNEVPDDPDLAALYDRFPLRLWSDNVAENRFAELMQCGWQQERQKIRDGHQSSLRNITTSKTLRRLHQALNQVNFDNVGRSYQEAIRRIRSEGIEISDRRAVKLLKLVAAAALRRGSLTAEKEDFHILRHCWNTREQVPHLEALLAPYLEQSVGRSPLRSRHLEALAAEITLLEKLSLKLNSDIDLADFLHQAERLRRELMEHPEKILADPYRQQIEGLIDVTLNNLEK
ncbi:MAG: AAA family ATPase [Deltaproteobacteria bacterium]|nr:AAA family ATPase [Deltaproteobacteria bacterium]